MRIANSLKYDGWGNTLRNALTVFKKKLFYRSHTVLLEVEMTEVLNLGLSSGGCGADVDFVRVDKVVGKNLLNLNAKRVNAWLEDGANLYLAVLNGKPVGYTVVHLKKYFVDGVGLIDLEGDGSLWIGPTFVDKSFRSQGINKKLINSAIKYYAKERERALTSANINNVNSISSFIRNGFRIKDVFICTYYLGRQKLVRLVGDE